MRSYYWEPKEGDDWWSRSHSSEAFQILSQIYYNVVQVIEHQCENKMHEENFEFQSWINFIPSFCKNDEGLPVPYDFVTREAATM